MNLNIKMCAAIFTVASLMAGCSFDGVSMVNDSKMTALARNGVTKQNVEAEWGAPQRRLTAFNGQVTCYDYRHILPNGNEVPVYIGFRNSDNRLIANGMKVTCAQANAAGYLNRIDLPKQIY